jgi:hypothetical protein
MQEIIIAQSSLARSSRRYIAREIGLDLTTFRLTRDGAWISLAQRLQRRREQGLVRKMRLAA